MATLDRLISADLKVCLKEQLNQKKDKEPASNVLFSTLKMHGKYPYVLHALWVRGIRGYKENAGIFHLTLENSTFDPKTLMLRSKVRATLINPFKEDQLARVVFFAGGVNGRPISEHMVPVTVGQEIIIEMHIGIPASEVFGSVGLSAASYKNFVDLVKGKTRGNSVVRKYGHKVLRVLT